VNSFLQTADDEIVGILAKSQSQDIHPTVEVKQTASWIKQVQLLKQSLSKIPTLEDTHLL